MKPSSDETRKSAEAETGRWRRKLTEEKLAFGWVTAFVIGAVAIVVTPSSQEGLGRFLVIMPLLVYFTFGLSLEHKNTTRFADSLYFMGFLWTLVALIRVVTTPDLTQAQMFPRFGYALIATAAGMLLRVLVIQFQETLPDRMTDAQETISLEAEKLAREFRSATDELRSFNSGASQELTQWLAAFLRSLSKVQERIEGAHEAATDESVKQIQQASESLAERLNNFALPTEKVETSANDLAATFTRSATTLSDAISGVASTVTESGNQVSSAGKKLSEQIQQIEIPRDSINTHFVHVVAPMGHAVSDLCGKLSGAAAAVEGLEKWLKEMPNRLGIEESLTGIVRKLRDIDSEHQKAVQALSSSSRHLQDTAAAFGGIKGPAVGVSAEFAKVADGLSRFGDRLATLEDGASRTSRDALERAHRQFADVASSIEETLTAAQQLRDVVSEVLNFVDAHLQERGLA